MAYAFQRKNTILDSNQYTKQLKNKQKNYNHLFTNGKLNNHLNKFNHSTTVSNIVVINDKQLIQSLNDDYNNIIHNYDTLSSHLNINSIEFNNIISKINTINYKITLNEEKLNIYIKKLNDSNNLNDEYQQDILELEKTNINNKTQIDLLESYYTSVINKLNLNLENLQVNYKEALENNKNLELEKLILKETKERLTLEDELKKNELEIIKKKLEKETSNNEHLDTEIEFYEQEIIKYRSKVNEKNKKIDEYNNEKKLNIENINDLKNKVSNILNELEKANTLAIENKKIIEINTIKLQETEQKKNEILKHSKQLDIEYKKSIEDLNTKLIDAKFVAANSKNELDILLKNNNLIEEKYIKTINELDSYKKNYIELKDKNDLLESKILLLNDDLKLKQDLETKLHSTIERLTIIEIEKSDIEEKLNYESNLNSTLSSEIEALKNKETLLLKLIDNSDKEIQHLKNSYSIILKNKTTETENLNTKLNSTLVRLRKVEEDYDLKNKLYEHVQTENETIKENYNDKFKNYIEENKGLSDRLDIINIENIKLKILTDQLKHISYSSTLDHSIIYKELIDLVEKIKQKFGIDRLIKFSTHDGELEGILGHIYHTLHTLTNDIKRSLDIPIETHDEIIEEEEITLDSLLEGKYFTFGSKTTRPLLPFHYDATKLLKPEWRFYILTYSYPKWFTEEHENHEIENKKLKAKIYQRIISILQTIGSNKEIPKFFYEMGNRSFNQDPENIHGVRKTAHFFDGEYNDFENEYI